MRRWSARRRIVSPEGEAGEAPLRAFVHVGRGRSPDRAAHTNVLSGVLRQFREQSQYPMQTGRAERVSSLGAPRRFQLNYKVACELSINVFKPDTYGRSRFAAIGAE